MAMLYDIPLHMMNKTVTNQFLLVVSRKLHRPSIATPCQAIPPTAGIVKLNVPTAGGRHVASVTQNK